MPVPASRAPAPRPSRIVGVDAARAVALVGMASVHILPLETAAGGETLAGALAYGRASALFAVLAGVGIVLGTGGDRGLRDGRAHLSAALGLFVRGVLVGALGLWLAAPAPVLDPPVAVILAYYGLLFVVAIPLLRLPAGLLAAGAVLCCAVTPVLSQVLRAGRPPGPGEQPGFGALADPTGLFDTLALTGYYPVLTWTTYLLAGMAVGRLDLRRPRTAVALLVGGAALAVAAAAASMLLLARGGAEVLGADGLGEPFYGTVPTDTWWWLAVQAPHSGTPFELAHTTGTALAVLGAGLLVARYARPLAWLLAAVGSVPLTLYTLHVLAVTLYSGAVATDPYALLLGHVLIAVVIGALLRSTGARGPLERVVAVAGRAARRAVPGAAR